MRFIDANKDRPFFLYLAHSMPHIPLARSADFVGHSGGGIYGDVVEEIDGSTGRILDALRAAGIDRQTLVVFTSDNGPWLPFETHGGSAGPLREGKGTTWEGGVRTPAIFWWPGTVAPGGRHRHRVGDGPVHRPPAALAGARAAGRSRHRRRRSARAAQRHRPEPAPDALLLLGQRAARGPQGTPTRRTSSPAAPTASGGARAVHNPPLLFNLAEDPGEQHDIAAAHPDIVADLVKEAAAHKAAMKPGPPRFDNNTSEPGK